MNQVNAFLYGGIALLLLALVLYLSWNIPALRAQVSGRTAEREIKALKDANQQSEAIFSLAVSGARHIYDAKDQELEALRAQAAQWSAQPQPQQGTPSQAPEQAETSAWEKVVAEATQGSEVYESAEVSFEEPSEATEERTGFVSEEVDEVSEVSEAETVSEVSEVVEDTEDRTGFVGTPLPERLAPPLEKDLPVTKRVDLPAPFPSAGTEDRTGFMGSDEEISQGTPIIDTEDRTGFVSEELPESPKPEGTPVIDTEDRTGFLGTSSVEYLQDGAKADAIEVESDFKSTSSVSGFSSLPPKHRSEKGKSLQERLEQSRKARTGTPGESLLGKLGQDTN